MIIEPIKKISTTKAVREFRKFGLTIGIFLIALSIVLFIKTGNLALVFFGTGLSLLLVGLLVPKILRPLYIIWMSLATVLGALMSRFILGLIFYLIFTPIGLVMRILHKDLLDREIEPDSSSYWKIRPVKPYNPKDTEKQY